MPELSGRVEPESWVATVLRAVAYGLGLYALFQGTGLGPNPILCGVVATLAVMLVRAQHIWFSRVRATAFLALIVVSAAVGFIVARALVAIDAVSRSIGLANALELAELLSLGPIVFTGAVAISSLASRRPWLRILETALMSIGFVVALMPHEYGRITRPYDIVDPMIVAGRDPTTWFISVGALAAAVAVIAMFRQRRGVRVPIELVLLAFIFIEAIQFVPRPRPKATPPEESASAAQRSNEQSKTPVVAILFEDDYVPPQGAFYFRMLAQSQLQGNRLVDGGSRHDTDLVTGFPTSAVDIPIPYPDAFERTTTRTNVGMIAAHPRPLALESPSQVAGMKNPSPDRYDRVYQVTSRAMVLRLEDLGSRTQTALSSSDREYYTRLPSGDSRYHALAAKILDEAASLHGTVPEQGDPVARAVAVTDWLNQHGKYSLRSPQPVTDDPTGAFLFGNVTGFCIHFSEAAVYLLRSMGVASRVATGYAIDAGARSGSYLLLRGKDAHAWPEIWVDGVGWVVADVTPATVLDAHEAVNEEDLSRLYGELLRDLSPWEGGKAAPETFDQTISGLRRWIRLGALALLAAVACVLVAWKAARNLLPRVGRPDARAVYRAAMDVLAGCGYVRNVGESREAFAQRVGLASFTTITNRLLEQRFGSRVVGDAALLRSLDTELAARVGRFRRVASVFDVTSVFRAR